MRVAALFGRLHIPVGGFELLLNGRAVKIDDPDALGPEDRDLARLQLVVGARVSQNRRDVRRHVAPVLAGRDDQGTVLAGGEDRAGRVPEYHAEGVGPGQFTRRRDQRLERVVGLCVVVIDQLGRHLRVGFRHEDVAVALQESLPLEVVLHDAVVHQVQLLRAVGVGVEVRRLAVGCPAGMADAAIGGDRVLVEERLDVFQPALGLHDFERSALKRGDARGVISPVFERRQPRHKP